ncbi:MAG: hypothetical protein ACREQH_09665 [Candidatus Binatus sp.]
MRTIAGNLAMLAGAIVLSLSFNPSPQIALAQDQNQDTDADGVSSDPDTAGPPVVTPGCWQGDVFNDAQGSGTITFFFVIKHKKIVKSGSTYDIEYDEGLSESGPIKGKVNSKMFKWKGPAVGNQNSQCAVSGLGSPVEGTDFLDGSYRYNGKCTEVSGPHNPFTGGSMGKLVFLGPTC